jgi:hypothetical protein
LEAKHARHVKMGTGEGGAKGQACKVCQDEGLETRHAGSVKMRWLEARHAGHVKMRGLEAKHAGRVAVPLDIILI